ncbi:maleylpyruvate isomerase family mycothiol-dependent enzyme [Nocardioides sp. JQ2195]|uniref:maleylpyruvate isomerase family mycothiol-dependent enzyme n=1 Tax=Nocardioides sp. JQ2195 TaxID=2592334 RepID=UPI00143E88CB|nr:maleylpyruvate isomerase family mycothiol-dependent enzyme [Nocardioides sp. JQ2195]QIX26808.1 maleylpyruvate isomerase family mycothiol-dependent enzyme [Nocardioides sp. JQ2195]
MTHLHLPRVYAATDALLGTVDRMTPAEFAGDSVLPGWSRAHVVAHVAMNARCFGRAIGAALRGELVAVYESTEARDADIRGAAGLPVGDLRELLFETCGAWRDVADDVDEDHLTARLERVPGGPQLSVAEGLVARWREVEIHHADLGLAWTPASWSPEFVDEVLPSLVEFRSREVDLTLHSPEGSIQVGSGGPEVRGSRADLAWWLMGRGSGDRLTGDLPTLGPWR